MAPYDKNKKGDFNREDSNRSESGNYQRFAKDKRARKTVAEKIERRSGERPAGDYQRQERSDYNRDFNREEAPRRSYNPNFDRENRPLFPSRKPHDAQGHKPYEKRGRDWNSDTQGQHKPYEKRERNWNSEGQEQRKPFQKSYKPYDRNPDDKNKPGGFSKGKPGGKFSKPKGAPKFDKDNYPRYAAPKLDTPIRLNRFIAMSGLCSRREADDMRKSGVVTVNGVVATELGAKVSPSDEVRFNNEIIRGEKKVYILMNKPKGYVTAVEDPHADQTVMDLVKDACTERVYPVGRLDKNSLGVLLITNDGDLTKRLTHPSYNKKKVYQVLLDKPISKTDMEQLAEGIELEDGFIAADAIEYVGDSRKEVGLEIHSGRNRVVRRMFEALGYHVNKLDRVYFAGLTKQRLKRGAWRFLTPREVSMLKSGEYE